jgi:hypothetical protein
MLEAFKGSKLKALELERLSLSLMERLSPGLTTVMLTRSYWLSLALAPAVSAH